MTEQGQLAESLLEACRNRAGARAMAYLLSVSLGCEHRTIQQNFFTMIKHLVEHHARREYDLRNEASVQWAKGAVDADPFSAMEFPYI